MNKLPKLVSHPELIEAIIGQFAFMKMMAESTDSKFVELIQIDLNDVLSKADTFFIDYCTLLHMIEQEELPAEMDLTEGITKFLSEWKEIVDVTAIQQNVHNILRQKDHSLEMVEPNVYKLTDNNKIQK